MAGAGAAEADADMLGPTQIRLLTGKPAKVETIDAVVADTTTLWPGVSAAPRIG